MAPKADSKPKAKADAKSKAKKVEKEEEDKNKVAQPDKDAHDKEVEKLNADIEKLKKKKDGVTDKINEKTGGKDAFQAKREEIQAQINEISGKMDELQGRRNAIEQEVSGQRERAREQRAELNKEKKSLFYGSEEEIDARIAEIEYSLHTSSMPLKEEKKLVQEIQQLKKNRPKVAKVNQKEADLSAAPGGPSGDIKAQKQNINEEMGHYREARNKLFQQREALKKQREEQMGNVKDIFQERDDLNAQIQAKIQERNTIRDDFRQKEREYRDYQNELRNARRAKADEERAARQQEYELKKKQQAVDKLDEQPHVAEITLIEQTMKFCRSLVAPKGEEKKEEKKEIVHTNPEGSEVLRRKEDRDEEFYFAPTKGKKSKNKNKGGESTGKSIKHNGETFRLFDQLKLDAPLSTDDVPALLEKLEEQLEGFQEKVREWEQNKEAQKKAILEGMAELDAKKEKLEADREEEAKTEE